MSPELVGAVHATMTGIRQAMACGAGVASLALAKRHLLMLAERNDLFTTETFPLPTGSTTDRTFLIDETDGRFALYVCTSKPGLEYRPHDHGGSWAIIAAVRGSELHRFYTLADGKPQVIGETNCRPGRAVSMLPELIHSIHAGDEPLVHLHLYGLAFEHQTERREFDPLSGDERRFTLNDFSFIEDARCDAAASARPFATQPRVR